MVLTFWNLFTLTCMTVSYFRRQFNFCLKTKFRLFQMCQVYIPCWIVCGESLTLTKLIRALSRLHHVRRHVHGIYDGSQTICGAPEKEIGVVS